jgi:hypothetical protein
MNANVEKKSAITLADKKASNAEGGAPPAIETAAPSAAEKLKASIMQLDAERTELVKSTIENMKPGKPLDHAAIREINKIETKKNRLIVARFAGLLKKGDPVVQAIVHQIVEL